jgi:hypothetical protein
MFGLMDPRMKLRSASVRPGDPAEPGPRASSEAPWETFGLFCVRAIVPCIADGVVGGGSDRSPVVRIS